ncbi:MULTISPECIES: response regulator [Halobacteriovorax]|uniref:Response regulator n=1 Tax=Halobacteriovorax vibrionivorans TaxID=2152716 RepID=A0ABY0IGY2_9BACT|nr:MULTISPECIES: response regulator [Halobacteriovorax]AYF45099.1 response regulator receiver domain protein [Halobacteriovorax sp. BALOs_7]RZF22195.1 response regulator [Halobacteriovorax vibrionivorans]TGD48447.1 response regulator [Halobacteriovorax sp. Y22]
MLDKTRKKVVIAEDETTLNEIYVEILEDLGHEAVGFEDGATALDYILKNEVDFVVSDLKMPIMDGLTLLKELRKRHPSHPPVLIITGYFNPQIRKDALEFGVVDLISKPFDFEKISEYLDR